jgi:hypothetical protein
MVLRSIFSAIVKCLLYRQEDLGVSKGKNIRGIKSVEHGGHEVCLLPIFRSL